MYIYKVFLFLPGGSDYRYDYRYGSKITIPAGMTNVSYSIHIYDDSIVENNETFHLYIHEVSLPKYAHIGAINSTTVTIVDDNSK